MSKELDKEIEKVLREGALSWNISYSDMCFIAEHFYELGCRRTAEKYDEIEYNRQRAEESVPNDLEEASEEYLQKVKAGFLRTLEHPTAKDCFKDGAKWGAEQFAKIVRANLSEIGNNAQSQFEQFYFEITGTKMYGGYND